MLSAEGGNAISIFIIHSDYYWEKYILTQQYETLPVLNYHLFQQSKLEANTRNLDCIAGNSYLSVEDKLYLFVWKLYLCLAYEEDVKWMEQPGCGRKMQRGSGFKREERHVELSWVTFWILLQDLIRKTYLCVSKSYLCVDKSYLCVGKSYLCNICSMDRVSRER